MGIFEHFPYVNMHNINLDWLIKTVKGLQKEIRDIKKNVNIDNEIFIISVVEDNLDDPVCDRTISEIIEAFAAGKIIACDYSSIHGQITDRAFLTEYSSKVVGAAREIKFRGVPYVIKDTISYPNVIRTGEMFVTISGYAEDRNVTVEYENFASPDADWETEGGEDDA